MDAVDMATDTQAVEEALRLRMRPARARRADGGIDCQACGDLIPEARRRAVPGCPMCVHCQSNYDRERN